jgi:endonuclease/exonuclease/phosphatase family metal-dependent hydrolase
MPDIVALQELDSGLKRTGYVDQAREVAGLLQMQFHFHPSLYLEEGFYGNAILSRLPLKPVKAEALPTLPDENNLETRGVLWVEIEHEETIVQVLNTHLGLNRRERSLQIKHLTGENWLQHSLCSPPIIFCADLNALPCSRVYKKIRKILRDGREFPRKGSKRTWPSRFPLMKLDYIFVSQDIQIKNITVPWTPLTRIASDHLPVIAEIDLPQEEST